MNAAEHITKAEQLLKAGVDLGRDAYIASAQVHATLAVAITLAPRDTQPEPHSTAWCAARDSWDTVESGRRFDDLDPAMQAALAARWQARHG